MATELTEAAVQSLLETAHAARRRAYAPYSEFLVGAALLARDGRVYVGCNIENASFGGTVCAERVAIGTAVADGVRDFLAIAVVGGPARTGTEEPCVPCGICRQVLSEFCSPDFSVILEGREGVSVHSLASLLPSSFSMERKA